MRLNHALQNNYVTGTFISLRISQIFQECSITVTRMSLHYNLNSLKDDTNNDFN